MGILFLSKPVHLDETNFLALLQGEFWSPHNIRINWQGKEEVSDGNTDSDWAGCKQTGKATSGGAVMIGSHVIKGLART